MSFTSLYGKKRAKILKMLIISKTYLSKSVKCVTLFRTFPLH